MGLLNPYNLLWAGSLAVLIAIYLRSRSRPTLEISSLMLFDEAPAPAVRMKYLRLDLLFWLEVATVAAVVLALSGLYVRTRASAAEARSHALVFDLAAAMGARDGSGTRLDRAKKEALDLIDAAPARDRFSVISYAIGVRMVHPETADRPALRDAIGSLRPLSVGSSRAALASALMRAGTVGDVELFSDRPVPQGALRAAGPDLRVRVHIAGSAADNLAIVSLDPGIPGQSKGRMVVKNLAAHPHLCEVAIDQDGNKLLHQPLMFGPHEQLVVPFGPLTAGGVIRARILSADALAADNLRFAYAPQGSAAHVLVLSPDRAVRDDLARVLLAVNNNFIVAAADPAHFTRSDQDYALVVMHDCYVPAIKSGATLFVYPPASTGAAGGLGDMRVTGTVAAAQMISRGNGSADAAPAALGHCRVAEIPEWMDVRAQGSVTGTHQRIPLAAVGAVASGRIGLIAFDVSDHLLLDPDRLDALLATVDLVRELTGSASVMVTSTGTFLSIPASGKATVTDPGGSTVEMTPDKWGRIRLQPLWEGHYRVFAPGHGTDVYANYYNASESDLSGASLREARAPAGASAEAESSGAARQVQPLTLILIVIAMAALIAESAMLLGRASRWGAGHV